MSKRPLYVSFDVEADGPCPGLNSMLSLGAAAFVEGLAEPVAMFERNLEPLADAFQDDDTMEWWGGQPGAWAHLQVDRVSAVQAMAEFKEWSCDLCVGQAWPASSYIQDQPWKLVPAAYPAGFDWPFLYHYLHRFCGSAEPYGFQCLDMKTLAARVLGIPFHKVGKRAMPREWFEGAPPHTHKAIDDAVGQGMMLVRMLAHGG